MAELDRGEQLIRITDPISWLFANSQSINMYPEKPDESGLGTRHELLEGEHYAAKLKGKAYIAAEQDEGSFLSNLNRDQSHASRNPGEETRIEMANLFPREWFEGEVVYEIFVKAILIKPSTESN